MQAIGELYGKSISDALSEIYWESLKKYDFADVSKAFYQHINTPVSGKFFPKPADIKEILEGSNSDKANVAWSKVDNAIRFVGGSDNVVFDDEKIHAVIQDMGGWTYLTSLDSKDLKFKANEFKERYQSYVNSPPKKWMKFLPGHFYVSNPEGSDFFQDPRKIGDENKCQKILAGGESSQSLSYFSEEKSVLKIVKK